MVGTDDLTEPTTDGDQVVPGGREKERRRSVEESYKKYFGGSIYGTW